MVAVLGNVVLIIKVASFQRLLAEHALQLAARMPQPSASIPIVHWDDSDEHTVPDQLIEELTPFPRERAPSSSQHPDLMVDDDEQTLRMGRTTTSRLLAVSWD